MYLAGVRSLHTSNGYHSPLANTIKLNQTLRGIERSNSDNIVYWSAMTTAHFLLLRAGEFVVTDSSQTIPSLNDIELKRSHDDKEYMALKITKSKTDQKREGFILYAGHSKHKVCAVCAMKENLRIQRQHSTSTTSPLFSLSTGSPMSRVRFKGFHLNFTTTTQHLTRSL